MAQVKENPQPTTPDVGVTADKFVRVIHPDTNEVSYARLSQVVLLASDPVALDADLLAIADANNSDVLVATTAAFTTAKDSKLTGIEVGATADQTANEILTAIKTVDGPGSGLDADTIDGTELTALATQAELDAAVAAEVAARDIAIAQAVADLINGAPGALDALNELAAAMGNDAAFSTTVTNALAGKQPLSTDLSAIAALVSAANKLPYSTGAGTWSLADLSTFIRTLLDDADAPTARATLGVIAATESAAGLVEFATSPETVTGTSTALATHPAGVAAAIASGVGGTVATLPYVIASSDASAAWQAAAAVVVTAGADCATALSNAFASGNKHIMIAGTLSLLSAVSVTPTEDMKIEMAEGAYIQCGPQVGADPNNPPALLTIGGTRTSVLSGVTLGAQISAGARSATFSSVGSIVANDYVLLHITTLFGPNRFTEQTGEIIKVRSVSGNTLRFFTPVRYTYATTASAFSLERYVMPRGLDLNIDMRGNSSTMVRQRPLLLRYMRDVNMNKVRLSNGTWCNYGVRCEEIYDLFFDDCWGEDFCDGHGCSSTYTAATAQLNGAESPGSTAIAVDNITGTFPSPQATFAWLGNPGAVDLDNLIAFTAVVGGEPVRVIEVSGGNWTLAAPGLVNSKSDNAAISMNEAYLGYAYEMVGCSHVRGTINGDGCRHLWDVKSFNKRPVAFDSVLSGYANDCAGPPFSTHGSCDQAFHDNTTSEGCGGHEVFRGVHHGSRNPTCIHPTRWTRGIFDQHQSYPAMTWLGEGVDDGGTAGDGFVWQDPYLDAIGCPFYITGLWSRDRARGIRAIGRRYLAPTTNGVWLAGSESSGIIDIAVAGAAQAYAVQANPEVRCAAVQFCTETGGTPGMSVRAMRVRVVDGDGLFAAAILGARGPSVYLEGFATDVAASNSELDIDVEKRALGTSQTSATPQIVLGAGYHNRIGIKAQMPGTVFATALSIVGTAKRWPEWDRYSRFSDGRPATDTARTVRITSTMRRIPPTTVVAGTLLAVGSLNVLALQRYEGLGQLMSKAYIGVTAAISGGTTPEFAIGVYKDDGTGWAPALNVAPLATGLISTFTQAEQTCNLTATFEEPDIYWVGGVWQHAVAPSTYPQLVHGSAILALPPSAISAGGTNNIHRGWTQASVSGTPGNLTALVMDIAARPQIGISL